MLADAAAAATTTHGRPVFALLADRYGPIAFGFVALFAVWTVIIAPELERSRAASLITAAAIRDAADTTAKAAAIADKLAALADRAGIPPARPTPTEARQ